MKVSALRLADWRVQGVKGHVDKEFFERIQKLLKIVIPSIRSKEVAHITTLTLLLVLRTLMSIWLAEVNGRVVRAIVNRSFPQFLKSVPIASLTCLLQIFGLLLFAVPSSAVNSAMDYFTKLLALSFRERLTRHFHRQYLQKMFYYKVRQFGTNLLVDSQSGQQNLES